MKRAVRSGLIALMLLSPSVAGAQDARGFAELRIGLYPGVTDDAWSLVERVRPTLEAKLHKRVKLVATIEAALDQGRTTAALLEAAGCDPPEHRNRLLEIDDAGDYLDVDRLYLDVYLGAVDLRAGRQALNWGSAQFFNPTDPFPQVLLAEPWRPRAGVNAIRATIPFGRLNDVTAVVASNDTFDALRAAARVRVNWMNTDFALVGAWRGDSENALVGLDLRGTLVVGWWLEAAYLIGEERHEQIVAGIDYSFPILERATMFLQYYRNGAGSESGATVPLALDCNLTERDPFAPFVNGKNYLLLGASLLVDPELSITVSALQNLDDGTGFAIPTISYNVLSWLDTALSVQVPYAAWGDGGELDPPDHPLLAGLVPTATLTLWTRASF